MTALPFPLAEVPDEITAERGRKLFAGPVEFLKGVVALEGLPPADRVPFGDALVDTIGFLGVIIVANLMALLIYAFFAPFALFIFWGMNGFLLGREYFTLAAMRRVGREGAKALRRKHFLTIWVAGVLMAMPLSVPLVNLLIPIIGAATFTHIFHRLERR